MIVEREIKERLLSIPIFNCLQLVCLYARISRRFSADYYRSISFRKYNFLQLLSEYYKSSGVRQSKLYKYVLGSERVKKQQQIHKDNSDKKSPLFLIVGVETFS